MALPGVRIHINVMVKKDLPIKDEYFYEKIKNEISDLLEKKLETEEINDYLVEIEF